MRLSPLGLALLLSLGACDTETPPVPLAANDDFVQIAAGQSSLVDVLDNDTVPAGATLTLASVADPSCGTVVGFDDRGVTFRAPNAAGPCLFTYTASDGSGQTATATVTVTVAAAAAPIATDDTAQTPAGQGVTIDVLANDQGDGLRIVSFTQGTIPGSTVGRTTEGYLRYTPAPGYTGLDHFRYRIENAAGRFADARVTVNVVNAP